jgi:hypothetical protein
VGVIEVLPRPADYRKTMDISGLSSADWANISPERLASMVQKQKVATERATLVLEKQQDVEQAMAQALISLVQNAVPEGTGRLIDVRV